VRRPRAAAPLGLAGLVGVLLGVTACADDGPPLVARDVSVRAAGCSLRDALARGIVVAPGAVLTVAHVARGATGITVDGAPGVVVAIDPRIDAALVRARTTTGPVVPAPSAAPGPAVLDGQPVTVERTVTADVEEPSDDTTYRRAALVVAGHVERGESGSPVLDPRGRLLGMVFAASRDADDVAYAVDVRELRAFVQSSLANTTAVDLGRC
jgi:S1-C subfamily serine protease